mmetsp:Transcript_16692/g.21093  ORF Transcript_16692/g.21093 Transcript_16692/m.21093 type:complete len:220 (-) Transcript_16692:687-1346(-)
MSFAVSAQIATFSEFFAANVAFVRALTRVAPHVNFQSARPHEGLLADIAFKGTFAGMATEMIRQVPMRRKSASAAFKSANERLLPVMDPLMRFEVAFLSESLSTALMIAHKRLLSHMSSFVDFQPAGARIPLATDIAHEWLVTSVNQLMGLEVTFSNESFAALRETALKGSFTSMDAQMSLEIASLLETAETLNEWAEERFLSATSPLHALETLAHDDA